jgi:glycoprotein-N-acetylgalactosamine 3-beta-galactosyltransferase
MPRCGIQSHEVGARGSPQGHWHQIIIAAAIVTYLVNVWTPQLGLRQIPCDKNDESNDDHKRRDINVVYNYSKILHNLSSQSSENTTNARSSSIINSKVKQKQHLRMHGNDFMAVRINDTAVTHQEFSVAVRKEEEETRDLNYTPEPHPHAGARNMDGTWGYIADVESVRRLMLHRYSQDGDLIPPLSYLPFESRQEIDEICNVPIGHGDEGMDGWNTLSRVQVDVPVVHIWNETGNFTDNVNSKDNMVLKSTKSKILCAVYTYGGHSMRIRGLIETWGWRCDGFFAASNETITEHDLNNGIMKQGFGSVDLPHRVPESYSNMWQKTRSILSYMHDHYRDKYEYFYLCGDDTHLIVENLRKYLAAIEKIYDVNTVPLFIGQRMVGSKHTLMNGGGAGYLLNRLALERLVAHFPDCSPHGEVSQEDRMVSVCLHNIGIDPMHTTDRLGRQRFHGTDAGWIATYNGKRGFFAGVYANWAEWYGWKQGIDLVSEQTVSFHLLKTTRSMKRHHALLYNSCPIGTVVGDSMQNHTRIHA